MATAKVEENGSAIALQTVEIIQKQPAPVVVQEWSRDQIQLLKTQVAKGCSDLELDLFFQVCKRTGLDPFSRQIYAISRNIFNPETRLKEPKMSIQVSIDGFRLIASRSGLYDGSVTEWCDKDGVWVDIWLKDYPPAGAKTTVYRKGSDRPYVGACNFKSYAQVYNGKLSGLWEKLPDVMIGKVSEALSLRKAFPAELSGLYTKEEMDQADNVGKYESSPPANAQIVNKLGIAWEDPGKPTSLEQSIAWAERMLQGTNQNAQAVLAATPGDAQGKKGRNFINRIESIWSQH